jgi:hypothetical protein
VGDDDAHEEEIVPDEDAAEDNFASRVDDEDE